MGHPVHVKLIEITNHNVRNIYKAILTLLHGPTVAKGSRGIKIVKSRTLNHCAAFEFMKKTFQNFVKDNICKLSKFPNILIFQEIILARQEQ